MTKSVWDYTKRLYFACRCKCGRTFMLHVDGGYRRKCVICNPPKRMGTILVFALLLALVGCGGGAGAVAEPFAAPPAAPDAGSPDAEPTMPREGAAPDAALASLPDASGPDGEATARLIIVCQARANAAGVTSVVCPSTKLPPGLVVSWGAQFATKCSGATFLASSELCQPGEACLIDDPQRGMVMGTCQMPEGVYQ